MLLTDCNTTQHVRGRQRRRTLDDTALGTAWWSSRPEAPAPHMDQYTLFNPTPADKMRDFNTDRPTKSNVPYTVPAGHFQYEGDLFIYGYDNVSVPDTNITSWTVGNPTLKLGLLNDLDFEVDFSFYNSIRSATVSTGAYTISQASATPSRASNGTCSATTAADRLWR